MDFLLFQRIGEEKIYRLPNAVMRLADHSLSTIVRQALRNHDVVLGDANACGNIEYVYIKLHLDDKILKIGPIQYAVYPQYREYILISIFVILVIAFMVLLAFTFNKNLDFIYQIAEKYSHDDFSAPPKFSKYTTLRTLCDNILRMGDKIKNLMDAQRNLTRFVAHDCRMPVTTMLFAINLLEKETLSDKAKMQVTSMKEDLSDFDSSCMKQAFTNLLDNAFKHANTVVHVSAALQAKKWLMQIENDGVAITDNDKEPIFQPFVTLDEQPHVAKVGFGLGLYIAQTIVKHHQGDLTVTDSSLGGACFAVVLPTGA